MKEMVCIVCPRGCKLKVDDDNNVTGNFCLRGKKYALEEIISPKRNISSFIILKDGRTCSIKTSTAIPKDKIFNVMSEVNKIKKSAPVFMNEILIKNVLNTGADIISTREMKDENTDN